MMVAIRAIRPRPRVVAVTIAIAEAATATSAAISPGDTTRRVYSVSTVFTANTALLGRRTEVVSASSKTVSRGAESRAPELIVKIKK
jgi:hypothetical protein